MGITFLGNTSDFKTWFFNIDGKTFAARNNSNQSPLEISFADGRFFGTYAPDQIVPGAVIVKNTGFDIISGTSQTSGNSAGMVLNGIVEWTYAGLKYRSRWTLTEGRELSPAIPEEGVAASYDYVLDIVPPYVIYDGPAGGAVGTGVASQAVIEAATGQIVPSAQLSTAAPEQQYPLPMSVTSKPVNTGIASPAAIQAAQSGEAIQETRDAIAAAFKALFVSKSQGTVNVNAFNNARIELKNAKDALAVAKSRATPGEQILMSQLEEQVDTIQGEVNIQLRYLQAAQTTQTPSGSYGGPSGSGYTQPSGSGYSGPSGSNYPGPSGGGGGSTPRKVTTVFEPSKPYGGPSGSLPADTAAGPDWVKLALQVGTAYLLLS